MRIRLNPLVTIVALGMFAASGAALAQTEACGGGKPKLTKKVDKPLGEAQKARDAKNWEEVLVKVAEAEAVPVEKSEYDLFWMNEFKGIAHANLQKFPEAGSELQAGMNSPWAPLWTPPRMPADGKVVTAATFSEPGTYVLKALADDGALTGEQDVTVTVTK